jgi:hypothetical protein
MLITTILELYKVQSQVKGLRKPSRIVNPKYLALKRVDLLKRKL